MKKYYGFLACSLLLAAIISCSKSSETTESIDFDDITIMASMDEQNVLDEDGNVARDNTFGSGDDHINLFLGTSNNVNFVYEETSKVKTAPFVSTVSGSFTPSTGIEYNYKAHYPHSTEVTMLTAGVTSHLPVHQYAAVGSLESMPPLMIGQSKNFSIQLHTVTSFLCFSVYHEGIDKVTLYSNDESRKLVGTIKFSFDDQSVPEISDTTSGVFAVSVSLKDKTDFIPGEKYFFRIFPCDLSASGYTITYHSKRGFYKVVVTSTPGEWERNRVYMIKASDKDAEFIESSAAFTSSEEGDVVHFAPSNLMYDLEGKKWYFAAHQYDCIGNSLGNTDVTGSIGSVDLFGWSVNSPVCYFGMNNATSFVGEAEDGDFLDWGVKPIWSRDGSTLFPSGTWYTPDANDMEYITSVRPASKVGKVNNARYIKATVAGVPGLMLFPDVFSWPSELDVPKNINVPQSYFDVNVYSAEEFEILENLGALFLPAGGYRLAKNVLEMGAAGRYWMSNSNGPTIANALDFTYLGVTSYNTTYLRYYGSCVRLAKVE